VRVALLTEGVDSNAKRVVPASTSPSPGCLESRGPESRGPESRGPESPGLGSGAFELGGWCRRLLQGLPEHEFRLYVVGDHGGVPMQLPSQVRSLRTWPLRGPRPPCRLPRGRRRGHLLHCYEDLVRSLVDRRESEHFGAALYALAAAQANAELPELPALLTSAPAQRILERVWQAPGADTVAGSPLVGDVLVAADLLEQCLRPLSAPWYGAGGSGRLADADLCHVAGGGPVALPALIAKQLYGIPFISTEHRLHLRDQYLGYRTAPYRWPVRALMLSFFRLLAGETYRQAAILTPGSAYDRRWLEQCGADPGRIRVIHEGTPDVARSAAGPEHPGPPTLVWSDTLDPGGDPRLVLLAFAQVRAELPQARLRMYGTEPASGHLEDCRRLAENLGLRDTSPADTADGRPGRPGRREDREDRAHGGRPGRRGDRRYPGAIGADQGPNRSAGPAVVFARRPEAPGAPWGAGNVAVFTRRSQMRPGPLVDAMLSGRAVIATDTGMVREVLGPAGLVVPPAEPQALAAACLALLRDDERRSRLGTAGRLRAQQLFAVEPVVEAFGGIYLEVVSRWPAFPDATTHGQPPRPFSRPAEFWAAGESAAAGASGAGETPCTARLAGQRLPEAV
jgi:glycosyltransferase involved in cell wall biosynthesis